MKYKKIAAKNSRYAELIRKIDDSKHRLPNTKADALRKVMRSKIMQSLEFKNITAELTNTTKNLSDTLCK